MIMITGLDHITVNMADSGKTAEFAETQFLGKRAVSIQTVLKPDQKIEIVAL